MLSTEIFERRKAEEAVKIQRHRFSDILELLPAYVVLLAPDYHVPFANKFFRERFGESHGRRCFEYLFGRTEPCERCETFTVLDTMKPHEWEWTGPDARDYYIFDYPFTDTDGSTLIMEMGIDITEQKRAEAALRRAHDELEMRVEERTRELYEANKVLQAEITERKTAVEALCRSQEELAAILASVPILLLVVDQERRVVKANDAAARFAGHSVREMIGLRGGEALNCLHSMDDPRGCGFGQDCKTCVVRLCVLDTLETGKSHYQVEWRFATNSGGKREQVSISLSTVPLASPRRQALVCIEDVSERTRAAEALTREKDIIRAIAENTGAQIAYLDRDMNFVMVNSSYEEGCGHSARELIGRNHFDLFPNEENEKIFARIRDSGMPAAYHDKPFIFADQPERGVTYWDWTLVPVKDGAGEVQGLVLSLIDTTERVRIEDELKAHRERLQALVEERTRELEEANRVLHAEIAQRRRAEEELRALSNRVVELQEEERRSLAHELHDQTGQSLTFLKILLARMKQSVPESVLADIQQAEDVTAEIISQVRDLSMSLRPSMLEHVGLVPTLLWYFEEFTKRTGIHVSFDHSGMKGDFPVDVTLTAYRVIQEALTNVLRYADVRDVTVETRTDGLNLALRIRDRGRGFDVASVPVSRTGLRGMRERVARLEGTFNVESGPGKGTCVSVSLPLGTHRNDGYTEVAGKD